MCKWVLRADSCAIGLVMSLTPAGTAVSADSWPQRAVRVIVPFGSGSAPDVAARLYAERLALQWKRPVVVENRTGADGLTAVVAFAAMRDDHTLLFSPAAPISVFPFLHEKLGYDPRRDLVPIVSAIDTFGSLAVPASGEAASIAELIALARAQPGRLNWTTGGGAFTPLLAGFAKSAGLEVVQVSYRQQSIAIQDLAEARVQLLATSLTALLPFVHAGKIRLIAVTNKRRAPIAPDVPTAIESGYPELEFEGLVGFFGPRDISLAIRAGITAHVRAAAADTLMVERLGASGQIVRAGTSAEFVSAIEEQRVRMESIVRLLRGAR